VILGVAAGQTYEFIRDQLLMVLPHPAQNQGGVQDSQFRVNNVSSGGNFGGNGNSNSGNKSGGKFKSKSKNSIKNRNIQFQTGGNDSRKKCEKCKNFGHTHKECRTDMSKKCHTCGKMGHTSSTCTRGNTSNNKSSHYKPPHQNFQSHNVNTSNQPVYYTMEPVITPPPTVCKCHKCSS
jgi:hypothetical protein